MILKRLGIVGWENIEPIILAAMAAECSILFIGDHGTNKTAGFKRIATSFLGDNIQIRRYNTPTLQVDDFMGYINPESLSKEKIEWVRTGMSIWDADAALFDEISRANPGITNKLLESVWEGTVHGNETKLKFTAATMNPPERYHSMYLDPALASRFICIRVPGSEELEKSDLTEIINFRLNQVQKEIKVSPIVGKVIEEARKVMFNEHDHKIVTKTTAAILKKVNDAGVYYSPRQGQMCAAMIEAYESVKIAIKKVAEISVNWDDADLAAVVLSTIPEYQGIVKGSSEEIRSIVEAKIRTTIASFSLKDPLAMADDVIELIKIDYPDLDTQVTAIIKAFKRVKERNKLLEANVALQGKSEEFTKEQINILSTHMMSAFYRLGIKDNPDKPFRPGEIYNNLLSKRRDFAKENAEK